MADIPNLTPAAEAANKGFCSAVISCAEKHPNKELGAKILTQSKMDSLIPDNLAALMPTSGVGGNDQFAAITGGKRQEVGTRTV